MKAVSAGWITARFGVALVCLALCAAPALEAQAIHGVVRSASPAQPVSGAIARLLDADHQVLGRAAVDAEGRFELRPERAGRYYVLIDAPGFASALSDPIPVRGSALVDHAVALTPVGRSAEPVAVLEADDLAQACGAAAGADTGGIVVGQVRDASGETLRGAWVSAEWGASGRGVRSEGRSGVDGLYILCDVPAGTPVRIRAAVTDRFSPDTRLELASSTVHRVDLALPPTAQGTDGRLLGRIVDVGSGAGIALAEVAVAGTSLRRVTDANGHFAFDSVPAGVHEIRVAQLGYARRDVGVAVAPDRAHGVEIPLARQPIELDPVVVSVRSSRWYGNMRAFQRRMLTASGAFFARSEIERLQPTRLVDLLRRVPGVRIVRNGAGPPSVRMRGRRCDPDLVIDRVRRRDHAVLEQLRGVDLEAVEVYRSAAEDPGEFTRPSDCGAILVWTRRAVV